MYELGEAMNSIQDVVPELASSRLLDMAELTSTYSPWRAVPSNGQDVHAAPCCDTELPHTCVTCALYCAKQYVKVRFTVTTAF